MKHFLAWVACATFCCACSNEVIIEPNESTGASGGGSSSASSSSSSGDASMVCAPKDPPNITEPTCKDLGGLILRDPVLIDGDGDGVFEAGETALLTVQLEDVSGYGFNHYPGVIFAPSDVLVSVKSDSWFFAVLPCTSQEAAASLEFAPEIPPNTDVTITVRVGMLNQECPDTYNISVPLKIQ